MKLVPLHLKKSLHKVLKRLSVITVSGTLLVAMAGVFGGGLYYERKGSIGDPAARDQEKAELKVAVNRLVETHKIYAPAKKLAEAVKTSGAATPAVLNGMQAESERLQKIYEPMLLETGIRIAHARHVSVADAYYFTQDVAAEMTPLPDYFPSPRGMEGVFFIRPCQGKVMSAPGFTPTEDSARAIMACSNRSNNLSMLFCFLAVGAVGAAGIYGAKLGRRWDKTIPEEEEKLRQAAEDAKNDEMTRFKSSMTEGTERAIVVRKQPLRLKT